ncbi:MAG TPA: KH domain-containing protein [Candidatus Protoclostridium stercorigallinarum]|uniref:RNA-binding protein KhpA n=1 Tax=Candidatus Protoclostridium stercorigallinarum TaxID=2838741 RepID=A0A9D1Q2H7_9FIRM|nr:KH domain-containing protein [Candidatus Protoclostridium stercorigallinarum]
MQELVEFLVGKLVDDKSAVKVEINGETISVTVSKEDMGKMIGKQGRTAKALRTIVKAAGAKEGKNYTVELTEI